MLRYGQLSSGVYTLIDNLNMTYNGNQLKQVTDTAEECYLSTSADFKDYANSSTEYTYNYNGAIVSDQNKGIQNTVYNDQNLPTYITINNSDVRGSSAYSYTATGEKLRVVHRWENNVYNEPPVLCSINDYFGNVDYSGGKIFFENGYIQNGNYYFYIRDHLGSNRAEVSGSRVVLHQSMEYYPFGMSYAENMGHGIQPFKYNGKELTMMNGLNLYDYHARQYDPAVGRFLTIDPLAEEKPWVSPYVYCLNNPIRYTDPDGRWEWDKTGNLAAQKGDNSYTLAKFLGTKQKNALMMLNRGGYTVNDKGILNLKVGQKLSKDDLWVGTKSGSGLVVNNTKEATNHYLKGNGEPADVGDQSTRELLSSDKFQKTHNKITSQKVEPIGYFNVDLTDGTFHVGHTNVDYRVSGNGNSSSVSYTLFVNDGFWDPDFIDEKAGVQKADGPGPNLERLGGTPYPYKTRERIYFFKPVKEKK